MRTVKKTIKVKEIEAIFYNRETKQEVTARVSLPEFKDDIDVPGNCVLLEQKTLSEKEVVYSMAPDVFFKNATIVEE